MPNDKPQVVAPKGKTQNEHTQTMWRVDFTSSRSATSILRPIGPRLPRATTYCCGSTKNLLNISRLYDNKTKHGQPFSLPNGTPFEMSGSNHMNPDSFWAPVFGFPIVLGIRMVVCARREELKTSQRIQKWKIVLVFWFLLGRSLDTIE